MPKPRNERLERKRIAKAKRSPNSDSRGDNVFRKKLAEYDPHPTFPTQFCSFDKFHHGNI